MQNNVNQNLSIDGVKSTVNAYKAGIYSFYFRKYNYIKFHHLEVNAARVSILFTSLNVMPKLVDKMQAVNTELVKLM